MKCTWSSLQACSDCLHAPDLPVTYNGYLGEHVKMRRMVCRLANLVEEINRGKKESFAALYKEADQFKKICDSHIAIEEAALFPVIGESWSQEVVDYLKQEHSVIKENLANILLIVRILEQSDTFEPLLWKNCEEALWDSIELLREHWYKEEFGLLPLVTKVLDEDKQELICSAFQNG